MIPARSNQQSLNFTTCLILALFPYRTWDFARYTSHYITATCPLECASKLQRLPTLPTQTNTNPPLHYNNNTTGKHVLPHHPPRRLRLPPLNLPRPRIPRFELRNLSPRQSNSYRLRPVRLFLSLFPSIPSHPTNTFFLDVSAAATISAPNLAKNSPYQNATASRTKS